MNSLMTQPSGRINYDPIKVCDKRASSPRGSGGGEAVVSKSRFFSLCNLGVVCVSVVKKMQRTDTTETGRTPRLHREEPSHRPASRGATDHCSHDEDLLLSPIFI